jgi:hypothetical protein
MRRRNTKRSGQNFRAAALDTENKEESLCAASAISTSRYAGVPI